MAVVVLGEWAAKVQAVRRWASGRMVSVELQMGNNQVVWLAVAYAPTGLGVAQARRKRRFLEQCSEEMREAGERGVARRLALVDANFWESEADHDGRAGGWLPGVEWREEMDLADAWRVRHAELPGFTRGRQGQPDTRIDYVWLDGDWEEAVEEAWVGPQCGEVAGVRSDHRPLVVQLRAEAWVGEGNRLGKGAVTVRPDPAFVPRHWIAESEAEYVAAMAVATEMGRLPTKVRWEDVRAAQADAEVRAEMVKCRELAQAVVRDKAEGWPVQAKADEMEGHWQAAGRLVKAAVGRLRHQPAKRDCERKGGGAQWGRAQRYAMSVRRWGRLMLARGWELSAFTPAELAERWPTCADESDPLRVPARMMELWAEAGAWAASEECADEADSGGETELEDGSADSEEREAARWARRVEQRAGLRVQRFAMLQRAELRKAQKECGERRKKWRGAKARLDREERDRDWEAGRTRGVYREGLGSARVTVPADAIRVSRRVREQAKEEGRRARGEAGPAEGPGDGESWEDIVVVTEPDTVRRACAIEGWRISETSSQARANRRTNTTPEQRRQGQLDARFSEPGYGVTAEDLAKLRECLKPAAEEDQIPVESVLRPWTGQRVRELARQGAASNTAPGPSGLVYKYLAESSDETVDTFAAVVGAAQDSAVRQEGWRRAYEWPIPKSGAGGGSLDGARRICMVEIGAKMLDGEIGRAVAAEWQRRDTLHGWQGGFTKGRGAGDLAAAGVSVVDRARRGEVPMYAVFLDVAKAFPSAPHFGIEVGLAAAAVPAKVAQTWMEAERGQESGKVATVQTLTEWGPTEDIEAEGGLLMGQTGSPPKWLVLIDPLLWWLEACGVKGVEVRRGGKRVVVMAFADDLALFVPGSLAEVQRALLLIDHFFRLFGVDLNPSKSIVMKVGGKAAEAQWQPEERLWVERDGGRKELRRAGRHEGVPYLGAKMQADGKWGAAERDIRRKVEGWCARVERSSLTLGQASRVLLSAVGGAVQYAAQAMPLSDECLRAIDRRVGRAVGL